MSLTPQPPFYKRGLRSGSDSATCAVATPQVAERPIYQLTLKPLADPTDPDGIRRLRALLKIAHRRLRIRCIEVHPVTAARAKELTL